MKNEQIRCIIGILLENEASSLSRVVGLFSQRNYNIESLTVAPTQDETLSRVTLITTGDEHTIEQIIKQLNKLVSVYKVLELMSGAHIEREMLLLKVKATGSQREEIKRTADIFGAQIVDVTRSSYIVEFVGNSKQVDTFLQAFEQKDVLELVRSGVTGLSRGEQGVNIQ